MFPLVNCVMVIFLLSVKVHWFTCSELVLICLKIWPNSHLTQPGPFQRIRTEGMKQKHYHVMNLKIWMRCQEFFTKLPFKKKSIPTIPPFETNSRNTPPFQTKPAPAGGSTAPDAIWLGWLQSKWRHLAHTCHTW
jgi:hypothetical protein